MAYPRLDIHVDVVKNNVKTVQSLCREHGIHITGVTKVFSAAPPLVQAYIDGGLAKIGDARIENLKRVAHLSIEKWLIRVPSLTQVKEVIRYADVSMNSEIETLCALNEEAKRQHKKHKVILMVDLGDLREGYVKEEELLHVVNLMKDLSSLILYGVGTNLSCLSFVLPSEEKMQSLFHLSQSLPLKNPIVSGGNSATIALMMEGGIPKGINNLRLGESLLFGKERKGYTYLKGTRKDAFILQAEIVELKEKPSLPWGEIGVDSYGIKPESPLDTGIGLRALLAIGKQDCDIETMTPLDPNITILGASSDYLIVRLSGNKEAYHVGSIIPFALGYFSLMRAQMSSFIEKHYIS